ncbi:S8 family peptidase [Flavobacterium sp. 120]|uniref:S8 family peptidase n=1 Tax=Flavobacterium sp. 120 TaxID=2135626 RepID=UPI000EAFBC68|nr:S8 family peptidase [Flavobacterium sp. 120]RKS14288.1 subtilase family protein [Flavobacterium sp. 120]
MSENTNNRRPILYNGEVYSHAVTKKSGFGEKSIPYTYEDAKDNLLRDISTTRSIIKKLPDSLRMPNEIILSFVVHPEFTAKSYYPTSLFDNNGTEKFGIQEIGSRVWRSKKDNSQNSDKNNSKMYFVRATEGSLERLENHLNSRVSSLTKGFQDDIRKISSFGLLESDDQILGVSSDWSGGKLEAVLHPFDIDRNTSLSHFLEKINAFGVNIESIKYKQYHSGVTFISFDGNREILKSISGYNPLRTIHPLKVRELPSYGRTFSASNGPKAPVFIKKSPIVIGVIDGGVNISNPYLVNYVESEFPVSGNPISEYLDHGSQVSGVVLYGALNKYKSTDVIAEPYVSVKSFGVLSSETTDPDLYDAIDAIEKIVPLNKDISVYNLSLGPSGPILDDNISRFTYSCDLLSYEHGILFCIAVGNDGEVVGYDRIQSPSDSVNCLAVGAYTKKDGKEIRAPYSSIGPGREGSKMKPDIVAFGGCDNNPIHLISDVDGKKVLSAGTSFSSPIVASVAGRLIGESKGNINALIAKALIIHSTTEKSSLHTNEMGHGIVSEDIDDIVNCIDKSYTVIYQGQLDTGKYAEFAIPWDNSISKGSTSFKWTLAVLTDVDHLSPDDYTSSTIEVAFFPNKNKYIFKNVNNSLIDNVLKKSETVDIDLDPERAKVLTSLGWTKSKFPVTNSPKKQFKTESDLRNDLKWDTLDTRKIVKQTNGIRNPSFHIHALGRGSRLEDLKVKFALILTVTSPKSDVDLYSSILSKFPALLPIELVSLVNVDVRVS